MNNYQECLEKCYKYIAQKEPVIPCTEYDWETCLDVVITLKSEGIDARCIWGDIVLCIRVDYEEEDNERSI